MNYIRIEITKFRIFIPRRDISKLSIFRVNLYSHLVIIIQQHIAILRCCSDLFEFLMVKAYRIHKNFPLKIDTFFPDFENHDYLIFLMIHNIYYLGFLFSYSYNLYVLIQIYFFFNKLHFQKQLICLIIIHHFLIFFRTLVVVILFIFFRTLVVVILFHQFLLKRT